MKREHEHRDSDYRDNQHGHGHADHDHCGHGHKEKTVTIIVDGTPHEVPKKEEITYDEVIALAYPGSQDPDAVFSVTYMRGHGGHEGILAPGGSVKVKEGMAFRVDRTGQS